MTRGRGHSLSALTLCATLAAALGCGGDDAPPPATVAVGDVVIETDPLRLILSVPSGDFAIDDFVEVGTVAIPNDDRYYDPSAPDGAIVWRVATRATAYNESTSTLTLDNGATLALVAGPVEGTQSLTVDVADVDGAVMVRLVMPRDPDEPIFGFGENFAAAEAGGSVREMQFRIDLDSESALNEQHVPIPLALWPARSAGLFVEDPRPGAFDIGRSRADRVLATFTLGNPGPLTAHLYSSAEPLALLRRYAELTALPALPPLWAFAPQQWRNAHEASQEVRDDAEAMRALDIPGSVMWIDNPWQTAYNDFTFDEERFAEPEQLIADLTALGYKVIVWSTPYVNKNGLTADDFAAARSAGYLVTDNGGLPFVFPWQDGPGSLVDFTAAGATAWWRERIARITDLGIVGFKLDFGEDIVPEIGGVKAALELAGGDAQIMHERYTYYYHEAYYGALAPGDGFLITRAGTYGDQAVNTCIWPGDLDSDFSLHGVDNGDGKKNVGGLPAAIAGMLSLSVSGYPFFGSDIGGFRDGPTSTETLIRWSEYAALGTIMQLGGGGKSHNPWDETLFDAPALSVYQTYARLHMDLVPLIYSLAVVANRDGTPVTRPTRFVYPDAASDDATFLVGDSLFVAPVIEAGATSRAVILPPGRWIDWWDGSATDGDGVTAITAAAPLERLPLWRRADAMVPMFARAADTLVAASDTSVRSYADAEYGRELRLLFTPTGATTTVALYDGASASASAAGTGYEIQATAGAQFDIFTFDIDAHTATAPAVSAPAAVTMAGSALAAVATSAELTSCAAPGCWHWDAGPARLRIRAHLGASPQTLLISQ